MGNIVMIADTEGNVVGLHGMYGVRQQLAAGTVAVFVMDERGQTSTIMRCAGIRRR